MILNAKNNYRNKIEYNFKIGDAINGKKSKISYKVNKAEKELEMQIYHIRSKCMI